MQNLNLKPQRLIAEFIERHTIAVDRCLPVKDRERAMFAVDLLLRSGRISEWHHDCGLRYWTAAVQRPLSDTSLARALGILTFCCGSESRSPVTPTEIETYYPKLFRHGLPAGHYVDATSQSTRLGNIRVDAGQSKINRIVARTLRSIQKYERQAGFRELIRNGDFELTWIVPTHPKQQRLAEALHPLTGSGVHLKVIAIPELLNIVAYIPQLPNAKSNRSIPTRV
ncbi:hypothetical protein V7x_43890 [Crateriforma conspicua]|uniref:Uncharacterized protein n=1 Tax=Crateriforma conspicua TaxID=2527996 RepID=A0A5C6FMY8_9PLAN|nr:hypothetical protein [Crateriforma conspicua]TWU62654.1 hypothetical protein V7x_43890 [Crateriforma conspicua]